MPPGRSCARITCAPCRRPHAEAINTGPLEATIHSMSREVEAKTKEGQELQRRWINKQTELVALQVCVWGGGGQQGA